MVTRLVRFLSETQVYLGSVDTPIERLLCQTVCAMKLIVKAPRRLLASLLIISIVTRPTIFVGNSLVSTIVSHINGVQTQLEGINALIDGAKNLQGEFNSLTKEKWIKDLVVNRKQIQLAKSAMESISTFDLNESLHPINITSDINLSNDVLGSTYQDGEYIPLRVRSRQVADTNFVDAEIFQKQLNDVADSEFDAMQVIKYQAQEGDKVGMAILNGNPKEAQEAVNARWQELLTTDEKISQFNVLVDQLGLQLDNQNQQNASILEKEISEQKDILVEDKNLMRELLNTEHIIGKKALELGAEELRNNMKNSEINNAGVTYMVESAKIQAQIQGIINDVQEKVHKIIELNKPSGTSTQETNEHVTKLLSGLKDSHNSDFNKFANQDELAKVKLRPSADAEINRLISMAKLAVQQQQIQLDDLQERNRHIKAMDDAGKANFDKQKEFLRSFDQSDTKLVNAANKSKNAMTTYRKELKKLKDQKAPGKAKKPDMKNQFNKANTAYFQNIKNCAPLNILKKLFVAYITFFKRFLMGISFEEGIKDANIKAEEEKDQQDKAALDMYDNSIGASDV